MIIQMNGKNIGFLSLCENAFKCPKCGCPHGEDDYAERLDKSKHGLIYRPCKGCKAKLGVTIDIRGNVQAWLKEEEGK